VGTWFLMSMISLLPVFLSLVAVWMTAQGVHPWIQDMRKEGYLKTFTYATCADGGYRSKFVENQRSISVMVGGPRVYIPVLFMINIMTSASGASMWVETNNDVAIQYMALAISTVCAAMIWNLWALFMSVWVAPNDLPFMSQRHKTLQGSPGEWQLGDSFLPFYQAGTWQAIKTNTMRVLGIGKSKSPVGKWPPCYAIKELQPIAFTQAGQATVDDRVGLLNVAIPRQMASGIGAQSRLTAPIPESVQHAKIGNTLASWNVIVAMVCFTGLAMQLCPQQMSVDLVNISALVSIVGALFYIALAHVIAYFHVTMPVVQVTYPYSEVSEVDSVLYGAADVTFKEGTCEVSGFNSVMMQRAKAEGVKAGMELICISVLHASANKKSYHWMRPQDDAKVKIEELKASKGEMYFMFKTKQFAHPQSKPKSIFEQSLNGDLSPKHGR